MMTEAARIASIDSLQSLLTDCRNTGDQLSAQIKKLLRDTTQMGNSIRQYQSMLSTNMTEQEKLNALLSWKPSESQQESEHRVQQRIPDGGHLLESTGPGLFSPTNGTAPEEPLSQEELLRRRKKKKRRKGFGL